MNRRERTTCPRCGQISFHAKVDAVSREYEESCDECGLARVRKESTTLGEWGGYGQIAYRDQTTNNRVVIPFDAPVISRSAAKREFLKFFRQRKNDAVAGSKKLSWFDCERQVLEKYDAEKETWRDAHTVAQSLCDDGIKRWEETYFIETKSEDKFLAEVDEMELETMWVPGVVSKDLRVVAIPSPIEMSLLCDKLGLDAEMTFENATEGTKLVLNHKDKHYNMSNVGRATLYETAKLSGASLGRLPPQLLAQNLNNSLSVARGQTLMLIRQGKVMALHPDGTYCVMPISSLVEITKKSLAQYGKVVFENAYHTNHYTAATWSLPDAQNDLLVKYQDALQGSASRNHAVNFMPVVRLSASDTAHSTATLQPMFKKTNGVCFALGDGISVRHEVKCRGGESFGLDLFEQQSKTIFAKFNESIENLKRMAETEIYNPVNCVVGIFNWINRGQLVIPRKYADVVRGEIETFSINDPIISMSDIYMSMTDCIGLAKEGGASKMAQLNIEEAIAKVVTLDWTAFDIGGIVAWGDKQAR